MNVALVVAGAVAAVGGFAHSYLGEWFNLMPLSRRDDLPSILRSARTSMWELRMVWHLMTVAWWGAAALLLVLSGAELDDTGQTVVQVLAATFATSAVVALLISRGRHVAWILASAVAAAAWWGTL